MKKITLLERQKKNPQRYNIYLDGEFAFGADEDTVVNFRLLKGKEISDEELEKILFETEIGKLMERMYGLFSRRQRTEREVREYMRNLSFKRKLKDLEEISAVIIDKVVDRLKSKSLLNDSQFATEWLLARQSSKKKGAIAIRSELMQKGVSKEIIDQLMNDNITEENEQKLAIQALEKKLRSFRLLDKKDFTQKALQFLIRKGFTYETAKDVVEECIKKVYNNS